MTKIAQKDLQMIITEANTEETAPILNSFQKCEHKHFDPREWANAKNCNELPNFFFTVFTDWLLFLQQSILLGYKLDLE